MSDTDEKIGFWGRLRRPFFALAPMDDVTDAAFRRIIVKYGKPDVTWTEFVSADGLCHPKGREAIIPKLWFDESERPIVAQLFSAHPDRMREAAAFVAGLGFDGIDINMGCPDRTINRQGAGAACIRDHALARDLVLAAQEGVREGVRHRSSVLSHPLVRRNVGQLPSGRGAGKGDDVVPVSVKTRLGWNDDELETWLPALLLAKPALVTIHARTRKEMSLVPARWERVKRAVEIAKGSGTLIVGNGDVRDIGHARILAGETGCDGVMLGRAVFGNPFLFSERTDVSVEERLGVMVEHTRLYEELFTDMKSFDLMKRHYQAYVSGFPDARELRIALLSAGNTAEVEEVVGGFLRRRRGA